MTIMLGLLLSALLLAGCQAVGGSGAASDPLPKGTALPPPEFEAEPGSDADSDEPNG